jgi:hypothetical protein
MKKYKLVVEFDLPFGCASERSLTVLPANETLFK